LENFYVPGCEQYEAWVDEVRDQVRQCQLYNLQKYTQALLSSGNTAGAIAAAHQLVRMEPLDETGHLLLLQALHGQGQRTEAMRIFQQYQQRL
jgi:DNA-binding SARP family transcriptional activator